MWKYCVISDSTFRYHLCANYRTDESVDARPNALRVADPVNSGAWGVGGGGQ